jgi:hypothetical protein
MQYILYYEIFHIKLYTLYQGMEEVIFSRRKTNSYYSLCLEICLNTDAYKHILVRKYIYT